MSMEKCPQIYDVVIIGYGPTGATLANLLGMRGFSVAVIEKSNDIYDKPRAITADHEVMRVFQECGLSDEVSRGTIPHPGSDYLGLENQIIKRFYPAPAPYMLGWESTWMFVQPELEAVLRRGVQRYETVRTFVGYELVNVTQDAGVVTADVVRLADSTAITLSGRYLVGCDGARSTVRRLLKCTVEDLAFDEWWMVIDAWLRAEADLPSRATHYCHPSRPGSFIIGPGNLRRWEIKILPGEDPASFEADDVARAALSRFVDTTKIEIHRKAIYRFHALVVDEWKRGNIFLMGDAAHQTPPFLGQGLCSGIRDAANFTWKLAGIERDGYQKALLDTYTSERKPHVRTVVAHAKAFGLIIGELDQDAAERRDRKLEQELASGATEIIRQKFIPGLEAGLIGQDIDGRPAIGAGDIFMQPWVASEGTYVQLDDIIGPSFLLIAASPEVLSWVDETARDNLQRLNCRTAILDDKAPRQDDKTLHVHERDALVATWLGELGVRAALVRPDHYVFGCAGDARTLNHLIALLAGSVLGLSQEGEAADERNGHPCKETPCASCLSRIAGTDMKQVPG